MRNSRIVAIAGIILLLATSCGTDDGPTLSFGSVASSVGGNVVELPIDVSGIDIVAADGDSSGDSGHFHVFVNRAPLGPSETIPVEPGIIHSAQNPVTIYGLDIGTHEFTVVLGDGIHQRIGDLEDTVTVDVRGPAVWGSASAEIDEGEDLVVSLGAEGVEIVAADGDESGDSGHFHVLINPESVPEPGEVIPDPVEGSIYHSAEDSVTIEGLGAGDYVIWIVLGDGLHQAFDPPVMDRFEVIVR